MKKIGILLIFLLFGCGKNNQVLMEDLINKNLDYANEYASKYDLNLIVSKEYSEDQENTVIKQSIEPGQTIKSKDKLEIVISLGQISDEVLQNYQVDELGNVPVMMYHGIHNKKNEDTQYTGGNVDKDGYQRTAEAFRNDLDFYYQNNYRMIRLTDYVDGIIDVEIGKSPIILTFDDGLDNNIKVTGLDENGEIIIDPNSAVGIMEEYKKKYPDFNITATFFVSSGLFNQPEYNEKIVKWLVDHNYDIGNHSYSHANFTKIDETKTVQEIGSIYKMLDELIPNQYVNIVALPYGSPYQNTHANFPYILKGTYDGYSYETKATLRVGWEADYSPFNKNFNSQFIKRIRAYDNNGVEFDIEMNFKLLENKRFISDGSKEMITIKENDQNRLNSDTKLKVRKYKEV